MSTAAHDPVLLTEVITHLSPRDGGRYIDGTFGRGGYTRAILDAAACDVMAIDRDPQAIVAGGALKALFGTRLTLVQGTFGDMAALAVDFAPIDGVVLDIGVSSPQLDDPARGFSFRQDGPLDMRMSAYGASAADLVNELPEQALADIIYRYGEERRSRAVARAIVAARQEAPITGTLALAGIVRGTVRPSKDGIDPATRTFQALRIAVNDELSELERALTAAEQLLAPGGRLVVVCFHSLEDRIVKQFFNTHGRESSGLSRHAPARLMRAPAKRFDILTRRPVTAGEAELARNPRARSAKLRAAARTDAAVGGAA
mgnify:FL=1